MSKTVVIVAGGTGGHLYPGIATARAIVKNKEWSVVFFVRKGDLGQELLEREGFQIIPIPGQGWPRKLSLKMLSFPFKTIAGFLQARSALERIQPQIVVGMGGYLSFPVLLAAHMRGVPTLIHEQNVFPGKANRLLGRWVDSIAVSFPESEKTFPSGKVWTSGLPIRPDIGTVETAQALKHFHLAEDRLTFLIFGGSLGARRINAAAIGAWPMLSDLSREFQVIHVTGASEFLDIQKAYQKLSVDVRVMPYCHEMAAALAAADYVICRAGASTIAELSTAQKPALLVPFPFASENHQLYNAEVLVNRGVADLIPDERLDAKELAKRLRVFLQTPERLSQMRTRYAEIGANAGPDKAADRLAAFITRLS
jgi:UDP-N-acetylglucosamine--N-acetylmuramyl-(pentapeptide) pyrophosphoryl-undecaprenol N-acetylglucosamine transferase